MTWTLDLLSLGIGLFLGGVIGWALTYLYVLGSALARF